MDEQQQEERTIQSLKAKAQLAGIVREMAQTPGFAWLRRELDKRIQDQRNEWLKADGPAAEKIKARGAAYNEIFDLIKSTLIIGDQASRVLQEHGEDKLV